MSIELDRRLQSSLGTEYKRIHKESSNIDRISFARVTKVNYRYNTVDVSSDGGDFGSGGKYSAKLPIQFGGTTVDGKPFGQTNPIEVGTRVLIGFVEGMKTSPVVLAIYGSEEENVKLSRSPIDGVDHLDKDMKQVTQQQFTVFPSLTYENIDGDGNRTVSFTGKSFITTEAGANPEAGGITDNHIGTEYEDLDSSYYYSGELIEPKEDRAPVILFKHQGKKFARNEQGREEDNHTFMWFLDDDGTYRTSIMQQDEDWRSYFEMTPDGKIRLVRQNDSKNFNTSSDRYIIGLEEQGIRMQVGNKYTLITPDGTFGNLGIGAGGGGGGGIPEDLLDRIEEQLDLTNRKILEMNTYMEQTESFIAMGANLIEEIEGGMASYESEFLILAEEIRTAVTETRLRDLVNEELNSFIGDLEGINQDAKEQLEIIKGLVEDGNLTPEDKNIMIGSYQNIKIEYPSYIEQAEKNDKSTATYENTFNNLVSLMDPIFEDMNSISTVDPLEVTEAYTNYFNARQEILSGILFSLQQDIIEVAKETGKVAKDATKALTDSGNALSDARRALDNLTSIANSDEVTPQEKSSLYREIERIIQEYPEYLEQAGEYEVDAGNYTESYEDLDGFITSTGVFDNMQVTTELNGQMLYDLVESYYRERIKLSTRIARKASEQLSNLHINFEQYHTEIVENSREIALIAESVIATEDSIQVAMARFSVMADRVSSKVTKSTFRREVDENRNSLNATGRNLFVHTTAHEGIVLNENDGTTKTESKGLTSAYIRVNGGTLYTGSVFDNFQGNKLVIAYYDSLQNHLKSDTVSIPADENYTELISPSHPDSKYVRISIEDRTDVMLQYERGSASGFHMSSNEDLLNVLEHATKEKQQREIMWKDKNTRRTQASENAGRFLADLEDRIDNIDIAYVEELIDEIATLEQEYDDIIIEAEGLSIQTINIEFAMSNLKSIRDSYLIPFVEGDKADISESEKDQVVTRFSTYLDRRDRIYTQIDDMFKASYEASVEVLDEVLAGSLEAERVARETAIDAENAAQSVSTLEYQMSEGNKMEARHLDVIRRIASDGVLTPVEKEEGIGLVEDIRDEMDWLLAQGRSIGLSTNDLENASSTLESYFSAFVTPEQMLKDSAVNAETMEDIFQNYHTSKLVFLANLLQEAKDILLKKDEEAKLARDESARRDREYQNIKNIISDSELAIERIEEKIEILENTHSYSIEILSTNGFTFKDRIINTTLKVTVRRGTEDITDEIPDENFEWHKALANGDTDVVWGDLHKEIGPEVELTHEDIQGRATFTVEVYLDKEEER